MKEFTYSAGILALLLSSPIAGAQTAGTGNGAAIPGNSSAIPANTAPLANNVAQPAKANEPKRLFGIIPNHRTDTMPHPFQPISVGEKFKLAAEDTFDPGTVILGAFAGGINQWMNAEKSYGTGASAYGKYFAAAYGTYAIGNFMTAGVFPSILHQDPRYFVLGCCGWKRVWYALGQAFWTHSDKGTGQFNYSEVLGNSSAIAISTAYYPHNRNASNAATGLGIQIGLDMAGNVLKEFWPEIHRTVSGSAKKH